VLVIKGVPFWRGLRVNAQNLLQKGRPFIMCEIAHQASLGSGPVRRANQASELM
jgi:hypothetical protein